MLAFKSKALIYKNSPLTVRASLNNLCSEIKQNLIRVNRMKIGIGRGGFGQALLAALSQGGKWLSPTGRTNRAGTNPFYRKGESAPDLPRHWHNRDNPRQADRIIAAESKRYARAAKLQFNTTTSVRNNRTTQSWNGPFPDRVCRNNLNPFYINRETV